MYPLAVGDIVVIQSSEWNRNCWPLGIVEQLTEGRDDVVRGARFRAGRSHLERSIQHLFPLELLCDKENVPRHTTPLNPTALCLDLDEIQQLQPGFECRK